MDYEIIHETKPHVITTNETIIIIVVIIAIVVIAWLLSRKHAT